MSTWSFGVAAADVTPCQPQYLVGMGWRTERSQGVYLPLVATALYITDGKAEAVLLSADIIAFPLPLVRRLRRAAQQETGVPAGHVVCCATHTHDAPRLSDDLVMVGETDWGYVREFERQVRALVPAAKAAARPGRMLFSRTRSRLGVNRRQWDPVNRVAKHAPNPEGAHDRALDTRWFVDARGRPLCTLATYGCHPTACGQYLLGGDYPGFCRQVLQATTRAPALWCNGCGANVRPWFSGNLETYGGGTPEAARQMGEAQAREILASRHAAFAVELESLQVSQTTIRLPLQPAWSYEEFRDRQFGSYAKTLGEACVRQVYERAVQRRSVPFEIQVLSLRPDHHLVYWSGEVCTDLGLALKDHCPGQIVTPHGYANGLVGYIPPRHAFPQGGYEPERSCCFFQLPAPFQADIEDRIIAASLRLVRRHRAAPTARSQGQSAVRQVRGSGLSRSSGRRPDKEPRLE